MNGPRLSHSAALILKTLSLGYCFGLDVMEATGLPSGTVYPAMRRLERDGLVESKWEQEEVAAANRRPARRYYEVTAVGREAAMAATERYPLLARLVLEKSDREAGGVGCAVRGRAAADGGAGGGGG